MAELADALDSGSSLFTKVQVQVLLPAPAASCRPQASGGDSKSPNLITRGWGSDLSLFTAPAASCRPQLSRGDSNNPNLITRWWGSDLSLFTAPKKGSFRFLFCFLGFFHHFELKKRLKKNLFPTLLTRFLAYAILVLST